MSVEDTKDFANETPRAKAQDLLLQVIENLKKQQRGKTRRMDLLIEANTHLNSIAQTEWDILLDELKDLQQDIDLLRVISKHLT